MESRREDHQTKTAQDAEAGTENTAYTPGCDYDIFISYRHVSNEVEDWVDLFRERLLAKLHEYLSDDVKIWQDNAGIRAGDQWREEIATALNKTAIFLAIVSRTYLDSDSCRKELDQFLGRVKAATEAMRPKIIPVFKQPLKPDQELPRELTEINSPPKFFEQDPPPSSRFREFSPDKHPWQFWEALEPLAQDIMSTLEKLRGKSTSKMAGTVYLATVGPELDAERIKLRSDLQQRGYRVLPQRTYIWNAANVREEISTNLNAAELSIHLVARTASVEKETPERARLQLEIATEAMKRKSKPLPLIWMRPAAKTEAPASNLIDYIEQELANEGVEYWQGNLEDFKTQIYDKLPSRPQAPMSNATLSEIALIVEKGDIEATGEIMVFLADKMNLEPNRIIFSGASAESQTLDKKLARCRKCVIFWGAQPEEWVKDLLHELAVFFGKDRLCVYIAGQATDEKKTFVTSKASKIEGTSGINEDEFKKFLAPEETEQ